MGKSTVIDDVFEIIESRKGTKGENSYVAKMFGKGRKKIAQKVGEEAAETIIEAVDDKKKLAVAESADLLFHLLILWSDMGIKPKDVYKELQTRKGISGIDEKKGRKS